MTTVKELCLAFVKYFIVFGNKRFLLLVPSPPIKVIDFFFKVVVFFLSILTFPSVETMYLMAFKQ